MLALLVWISISDQFQMIVNDEAWQKVQEMVRFEEYLGIALKNLSQILPESWKGVV